MVAHERWLHQTKQATHLGTGECSWQIFRIARISWSDELPRPTMIADHPNGIHHLVEIAPIPVQILAHDPMERRQGKATAGTLAQGHLCPVRDVTPIHFSPESTTKEEEEEEMYLTQPGYVFWNHVAGTNYRLSRSTRKLVVHEDYVQQPLLPIVMGNLTDWLTSQQSQLQPSKWSTRCIVM